MKVVISSFYLFFFPYSCLNNLFYLPFCFVSKFGFSEQGTWCAVVSYDACVRLCLHEWALRGSSEVHCFLENECALLRDAFG